MTLQGNKYNEKIIDFTAKDTVIEEKDEDLDFEEISQKMIIEIIRALPDGYRTVFILYVLRKKVIKRLQAF